MTELKLRWGEETVCFREPLIKFENEKGVLYEARLSDVWSLWIRRASVLKGAITAGLKPKWSTEPIIYGPVTEELPQDALTGLYELLSGMPPKSEETAVVEAMFGTIPVKMRRVIGAPGDEFAGEVPELEGAQLTVVKGSAGGYTATIDSAGKRFCTVETHTEQPTIGDALFVLWDSVIQLYSLIMRTR